MTACCMYPYTGETPSRRACWLRTVLGGTDLHHAAVAAAPSRRPAAAVWSGGRVVAPASPDPAMIAPQSHLAPCLAWPDSHRLPPARPRARACSHDHGTFFPGTGAAADAGSGPGEGRSLNIPWDGPGAGDGDYISALTRLVIPAAYEFGPDLVIVSAGFDAAAGDPLGGCRVTPECYGHMTALLMPVAPLVLLLEVRPLEGGSGGSGGGALGGSARVGGRAKGGSGKGGRAQCGVLCGREAWCFGC